MKIFNYMRVFLLITVMFGIFFAAAGVLLKQKHMQVQEQPEENPAPVTETKADLDQAVIEEEDQPVNITWENILQYADLESLLTYLYAVESDTYVTEEDLNIPLFIDKSMKINLEGEAPKILVFHTHSQEYFINSQKIREHSIVGIGDELCRILEEEYGIKTIHDDAQYDVVNGETVISGAYERMAPAIEKILSDNPTIEICIDLHRDILPSGEHLVWLNQGVPTAKIMFFNGMSRVYEDGELVEPAHLYNPFREYNLAFSLQMKLFANSRYPEFTRKNYIRAYRYSLHMAEKSLLIELGTDQNTVEEALQAVRPLAEILTDCVL